MKLRLATLDDLPEIARLGALMHQDSNYAPMDYDIDVVKETMAELMNKSQFVVLAEGKNGAAIGGMAGKVTPTWFGKDMVATDVALFVEPGARGSLAAYRLIEAFVTWARMAGAKQIRPMVTTGHLQADDIFIRLGFKRTGSCFLMEG